MPDCGFTPRIVLVASNSMTTRILIADDELAVRQLLELVLVGQGYEVALAANGAQLVRMAQERVPDLVLVDLMMPQLDGYEAIRQLRNDTRTAHLPMLILTAKSTLDDVVTGFETGADDYITKPFNIPELVARIKGHLRRASQQPVRNPLTGLPGNVLLTEELKYRLNQTEPFAYLYVDLDNFKAFNDTYGPARGDRVIKLLADVLTEMVDAHGSGTDFIGHIGGDDFAVLTTPEKLEPLCKAVMTAFDQRVRLLYDEGDLARGYLQGIDRQGIMRRFPLVSLSIGVATNRNRAFADYEELSRVAAEMKQFAKQESGSSFAVDVRSSPDGAVSEERRGSKLPVVLLIAPDSPLRRALRSYLHQQGQRVLEAAGLLEANALLQQVPEPDLIVADAQLGAELWELSETLQLDLPDVPLLAIADSDSAAAAARAHGFALVLRQPVEAAAFHAATEPFFHRQE